LFEERNFCSGQEVFERNAYERKEDGKDKRSRRKRRTRGARGEGTSVKERVFPAKRVPGT
jgi:hypothetical protein